MQRHFLYLMQASDSESFVLPQAPQLVRALLICKPSSTRSQRAASHVLEISIRKGIAKAYLQPPW